jgi:hypothetical protein
MPSPAAPKPLRQTLRQLHSTLAPFVLLPLVVTIFTGVAYRLGKDWFGLTRDQVHFLMVLHEGEYWGKTLEPVYVLLNGLGLLWMVATGCGMLWQRWSRWLARRSAALGDRSPQLPVNPNPSDRSDAPGDS